MDGSALSTKIQQSYCFEIESMHAEQFSASLFGLLVYQLFLCFTHWSRIVWIEALECIGKYNFLKEKVRKFYPEKVV